MLVGRPGSVIPILASSTRPPCEENLQSLQETVVVELDLCQSCNDFWHPHLRHAVQILV